MNYSPILIDSFWNNLNWLEPICFIPFHRFENHAGTERQTHSVYEYFNVIEPLETNPIQIKQSNWQDATLMPSKKKSKLLKRMWTNITG